ncbi:hypothetical protein [Azospirillum argentinense]
MQTAQAFLMIFQQKQSMWSAGKGAENEKNEIFPSIRERTRSPEN